MPDFADLERGYGNLWAQCEMDADRVSDFDRTLKTIQGARERYKAVQAKLGVPWWWTAAIHYRESSNDFAGVLHNGERIIGKGVKTTKVPRGLGPFASWEESAVDVITRRGLNKIKDWSIARCLYEAEAYNGWGYFGREASPYVWAGTNLSDETGKYVADGVYNPNARERQLGVASIWKRLAEVDAEVNSDIYGVVEEPEPLPDDITAYSVRQLADEIFKRCDADSILIELRRRNNAE